MGFRQDAARQLGQRLRQLFESGAWSKVYLALLLLFALFLLYRGILSPRATASEDRAALLDLRDAWSQAAPGYGLHGHANPREDFRDAYLTFHAQPTIRRLLLDDPVFAAYDTQANAAFSLLQNAELRADRNADKYAAEFNEALTLMDWQVDAHARSQSASRRTTLILMGAGLLAAIIGFSLLELRFRVSTAGEARNRALSRALIAAQEGERLRISYELHDAVAQDLATAKLYCGLVDDRYAREAAGLLTRAIEEVRGICQGLRPAELDRLGIVEAVARLCTETGRESGIDVKLTVEGLDNLILEPETEINLFRILQEALTNVRRHAQARHARVVLFGFGDYLELTVDDDGRGPRGTQPGLGRTGMEERARMIGGRFHFGFGPWGGASLRVTLPTRRKEAS
jgi:signal transduction histidine kinase